MPKMEFRSNQKASLFAYPPALEEKKKEEHEKVSKCAIVFIVDLRFHSRWKDVAVVFEDEVHTD